MIERTKSYIKGPDVMSKHSRTAYHYKKTWKNQRKLDTFKFTIQSSIEEPCISECSDTKVQVYKESVEVQVLSEAEVQVWKETVEYQIPPLSLEEIKEEAWEEEVNEAIISSSLKVKPWDALQEQIKEDLKKGKKKLPMSNLNQLIVLYNFATLRIKGYGCMAASTEIAQQWSEAEGVHLSHQLGALA